MVAFAYDTACDAFCNICGKGYHISFNEDDMKNWLNGSIHIQDALPYLTAGERELLISGTCGPCFDIMFPPLDNDE